MTEAVASVDGADGRDGGRVNGAPIPDRAWGGPDGPTRAIAEAVRSAAVLPAPEGARRLLELTVTGGPWTSAVVAGRLPSGGWGSWTHVGSLGRDCDRRQWVLGEGPACEAVTTDLVTVPDLIAEPRWPAWRAEAGRLGGRAVVAARLHTDRTLGAMTVYADHPVDLDRAAIDQLGVMAAHVSVLLDAAQRRGHLEVAMRSRGTIGQAVGRLVERYGLPPDRAFAVLRRISQHENIKVVELATALMETGDLPGLHRHGR